MSYCGDSLKWDQLRNMPIPVPAGHFLYLPNSQYGIARLTLPDTSIFAPPYYVWIWEHGGANYNPGLFPSGFTFQGMGPRLLARGVAIVEYDYPPGGKFQYHDHLGLSWESPNDIKWPPIREHQVMERALFPDRIESAARIVQFIKDHAEDHAWLEEVTGLTLPSDVRLHTDQRYYGRGGLSSGSWASNYANFMRDGDFGYVGGPISNELDTYYQHNHLCDVFYDAGGQSILSSFNVQGPNTDTYDTYGEYGWCGGYLLDGQGMYANPPITWNSVDKKIKMRLDLAYLLTDDNPRVTEVKYIANNENDPDGSTPSSTYYGVLPQLSKQTYAQYLVLGEILSPYDDLHHPINQFYMADKLAALGNTTHAVFAGRSQTNSDAATRGYVSNVTLYNQVVSPFLVNVAGWTINRR